MPPTVFNKEFDQANRPHDSKFEKSAEAKGYGKDGGKSKGKGKGKDRSKSYNIVEGETPADDTAQDEGLPDIPEEEEDHLVDNSDEEELVPGDFEDDGADWEDATSAMREAAECLTVTARRLQGVTLGRKFSGKPRSIEDRKKNSHCAACGERGHWRGDPACPMSKKPAAAGSRNATSASSSGSSQSAKGSGKTATTPKRVMSVRHAEGATTYLEANVDNSEDPDAYGTYFTTFVCTSAGPTAPSFHIPEVYVTRPADFAGFAVIDTACQKTVCSSRWLAKHEEHLRKYDMKVKRFPEKEGFQFGVGTLQFSSERAFIPVSLDATSSTCCLFGASVLHAESEIPLLLSLGLIEGELQAVLDFPSQCARLKAFNTKVPVVKINGHICLDISNFTASQDRQVWNRLSRLVDQGATGELLQLPHGQPRASAPMACGMETSCVATGSGRDESLPDDDSGSSPGNPQEILAVATRSPLPTGDGIAARRGHETMPTPSDSHRAQRQQVRVVQQVRPLRHSLEVLPGRLGRAAVYAAAAASAALGNFIHTTGLGNSGLEGRGHLGDINDIFPATWDLRKEDGQTIIPRSGSEPPLGFHPHGAPEPEKGRTVSQRPSHHDRDGDGRDGAGLARLARHMRGCRGLQLGSRQPLKAGSRVWLTGHLRQTQRLYQHEVSTYEGIPVYRSLHRQPRIDVLEIFAGHAEVTINAHLYGLNGLQPFDKNVDIDLHKPQNVALVKTAIQKFEPLFILVS